MDFDILIVTSWDTWAVEAKCYWADELRDRGYSVCFLTPSETTQRIADSHADAAYALEALNSTPQRCPEHFQMAYDIPSFRHLYFTEQQMMDLTRAAARERACMVGTAMERFFAQHDFDYCFQAKGSESHRLFAHYFTNHHGGTTIWDGYSPFDGMQALSTRLDMSWDMYETIPYEDITPSERERIETHIEDATSQQEVKTYSPDDETDPTLLANVWKRLTELQSRDRPVNVPNALWRKLRTRTNEALNKRLTPSIERSRAMCCRNRFVFFPLQYPVESRLTVMSPEFYDQAYLVRYLSRILPSGIQLFVKQHPNRPGEQSPLFIRRLERLENVTFLNPHFNAHEAIQHADVVTVINNTVGFESLYYQTPLVVLGKAFYDQVPAAEPVERLRNAPGTISSQLSSRVDQTELVESVYSLEQASLPSLYWDIRNGMSIDLDDRPVTIVDRVLEMTDLN